MKKILILALFMTSIVSFSQEKEPTFVQDGDLVKATYYYEDGSISTQGFFKDKKLTGEWVRFDTKGNKTQVGYYKEGKKIGKWIFRKNNLLKEVNYENNIIVSTHTREIDNTKIATNLN